MIEKSALLACGVAEAFELFTRQAGAWWPVERRHTEDAHSEIVIEPGGRFVERSRAGVEVVLGVVRVFDRPHRLLLDWYPGTGPNAPTEVEVLFEVTEGGTRVTVRHGPGRVGKERFDRSAPAFVGSWDLVLAAFAAATA